MILASLQRVDRHHGEQTVLAGASLELRPGERLALIGRNGAGKTTILRLLAGREAPDGGETYRRPGITFGLLDQDARFDGDEAVDLDVAEVADGAFRDLDAMERELTRLEREGLDDPGVYAQWDELHERFERRGGYARRARRDAVLHALGFAGREGDLVGRLSGGERTRLGLARLLMAQPDILLLDEPTNHLDLEMRAWLESFVGRYPGAAVMVSHDRAFLDGACDRTAEVDRGELRVARGNPSAYRAARAEQARIEARTRANEVRERERLSEAATRMKRWAGQNEKLHRRARAMERRLERYEAGMLAEERPDAATTRFLFPCPASVDLVLHAQHLTARYDRTLFEGVELVVRRGERVVITGPNGAGKTTLLRTLLGERPSDDPRASVRWGTRVRVAYYDQDLGGLDPDARLIEELIRLVGDTEAHDLLGRFLFPYEAQFKRVADLSGGERARLALLKLTLTEANVLVLDEPTNHLDVEMIEALEAALAAYEGTLLLVSHDRRFLETMATRVWEVDRGRLTDFEGDWAFYRRKRDARREARAAARDPRAEAEGGSDDRGGGTDGEHVDDAASAAAGAGDERSPWRLRRDLERWEGEVARLESELAAAQADLERAAAAPADERQREGGARWAELGRRHDALESELLAAMASWEAAASALAAKTGG
ncbi:MAG: ABC-F family ATP-binding cassette domain-containing protein [Trueperaceae bacterium]